MKTTNLRVIAGHNFKESKRIGDLGEKIVKDYLESTNYRVSPLSVNDQNRLGYDFRARNLSNDLMYGIEVKTDVASSRTGNLFIETSVNDKAGWFVKYKASSRVVIVFVLNVTQDLGYYRLLFVSAKKLKNLISEGISEGKYKIKKVKDEKYLAWGFIVPVEDIEAIASEKKVLF